ncbi:hypothetical protein [Mesorhizobium waimense]|uniref:hypothetical protein n=1 Tax=Mesorhizobium waimense TaxID=1300307 RepID=UPI0011C3EE61|nr:hypothetical protein [Mesorhizobium waimense]
MIKAFLPTGRTIDEQFAALSIVKTAHETGDYSALLQASTVEEVKTEQKTRRIEDQTQTTQEPSTEGEQGQGTASEQGGQAPATTTASEAASAKPATETASDADVPEFLKKDKKSKAA